MSKDDEALVRTTVSPKAKRERECWQLTKREKRRRPIRRKLADHTEAKGMRLVADHYPVRPGNGLRSVRPVRIRVLSVAQLVDAGALHRRMGTSGQIHRGTVTADARIRTGAVTTG